VTPLRIHRESFEDAALDTAVSHALLRFSNEGRLPESLRLYQPSDALAFSVLDRSRPGFGAAVAAAEEREFPPVMRLAGGRAAAFERSGLAFAWTVPSRDARSGIRARFRALTAVLARALCALGVDARVGEVAGEYCPGEFSINARGRVKLVGVGQRVLRNAAHVGGVIVVGGAARVCDALAPVYEALEFPFEAGTVGAVADEAPGRTASHVRDAVTMEISRVRRTEAVPIDEAVVRAARGLAEHHDVRGAPQREVGQRGKIVVSSA